MMKFFKYVLIFPFLVLIRIYQLIISPIFPASCRFHPTCSVYFKDALLEWGVLKGFYLGVKRISRCHPYGGFGIDEVPKKK
jgi:putative membrane protein insertion efficiency factor